MQPSALHAVRPEEHVCRVPGYERERDCEPELRGSGWGVRPAGHLFFFFLYSSVFVMLVFFVDFSEAGGNGFSLSGAEA